MKKFIYQLEKQQGHESLGGYDVESNERSSLLVDVDRTSTDAVFIPLLDHELKKIVLFHEQQEKELLDELNELEDAINRQEEEGLAAGDRYMHDGLDDDDDDDDSITSPRSPDGTRNSHSRHRKSSSSGRARRSQGKQPYAIFTDCTFLYVIRQQAEALFQSLLLYAVLVYPRVTIMVWMIITLLHGIQNKEP